MLKKLCLAAGIALSALFVLAGCKSLPSAQEQFNTLCPIVTADLTTLSTSPLVGAADQANLAKAAKANASICAGGAELNVTNLKAFHDSLLPVAIAIVQGNPLIPDQAAILIALQTFGPLVQQMVDQVIVAVAPAASAPVAASTPLAGAPLQ